MSKELRKNILKSAKRVVIKVGSGVISDHESGKPPMERGLSLKRIRSYAKRIKAIVDAGHEVILVSSGAIMAGRERLNLKRPNLDIPEKQACAAIGQSSLIRSYERSFEKQGLKVAQILLGHDDLENRKRYLNVRHTMEALLAHGVIPIINENDSVTVDEIKIGDNDTLSANVACMAEAQLLILLSDVDGLYTSDPSQKNSRTGDSPPELISHVDRITPAIEKLAGKSNNPLAVGGMFTKVTAAKKTMSFGIPTIIINGLKGDNLKKVFAGSQVGTLFWSGEAKIKDRKHWIAHTLKPAGSITVDEGAGKALVERGKSLLAAGVVKVDGKFEFGSAVRLLDEKGKEIARGLVNYNSRDLDQIKGLKTADVRSLVGANFYDEVIHRDDLVLV
ncbi:MAG: glutamate 5-kinase [Nitrospinota bacterium]|nr:glutamate 5-kinase [Nitrospinota bacterium]